jgi:DNA-directed RNA polymerase specialized sigma24 family protein
VRAPSSVQVIHDDLEFDEIQVQGWDEEAEEIEAIKEDELIRVQQEIERLRPEQKSIIR